MQIFQLILLIGSTVQLISNLWCELSTLSGFWQVLQVVMEAVPSEKVVLITAPRRRVCGDKKLLGVVWLFGFLYITWSLEMKHSKQLCFFISTTKRNNEKRPNRANQKPLVSPPISASSPITAPSQRWRPSSGGSASSYGDGWNGWRGDKLLGGRTLWGWNIYEKTTQKHLRFGNPEQVNNLDQFRGVFRYQRCHFLIQSPETVRFLLKQNHGVLLVDIFDAEASHR